MAELPRCASCRVGVRPGDSFVFLPDGRVCHVACPEVMCPVCGRLINPTDPIRRDGEALLHGHCWMRRAQGVVGGQNGVGARREAIAAKLMSGLLPSAAPTKTWVGYATSDKACDACGEQIPAGSVEHEVDFTDSPTLRLHSECFAAWQAQRDKRERGIGGGSAASPWTLLFDYGIAQHAAGDGAMFNELLIAGAQSMHAAAELRDTSTAVCATSAVLCARARELHRELATRCATISFTTVN